MKFCVCMLPPARVDTRIRMRIGGRFLARVRLLPCLVIFGFALLVCAGCSDSERPAFVPPHYPYDTGQVVRDPAFALLYRAVCSSLRDPERVIVAEAIYRSRLPYAEKMWLIYRLVETGNSMTVVAELIPAEQRRLLPRKGYHHWSFPGFSIEAVTDSDDTDSKAEQDDTLFYLELKLYKASDSQAGVVPSAWYREAVSKEAGTWDMKKMSAELPGGQTPESEESEAEAHVFLELYDRTGKVRTQEERESMAAEICQSELPPDERGWLLFTLVSPGMTGEELARIASGAYHGPNRRRPFTAHASGIMAFPAVKREEPADAVGLWLTSPTVERDEVRRIIREGNVYSYGGE